MTRQEAHAEAYTDALMEAREAYAGQMFDRWVEDHPDATLAEADAADAATTAQAAMADAHDLHDYGFPWRWCDQCRAELMPERPLPGIDAGGFLR